MSMEQRQHPRFRTQLRVVFSGPNILADGQVTDLALGGCAVESATRITPGMPLALRLSLPGESIPLEVNLAVVRWAEEAKCGMQFLVVPTESQQRLGLFLSNL